MITTLLVSLLAGSHPSAAAPDTIVVCPPVLRATLEPWVSLRTEQGHRVQVVDSAATPEQVRARIRQHASAALRSILLVGDVADARRPAAPQVPTFELPATVNVRFGSEPTIASDWPYADLDGDAVADVAVGRLPARTTTELAAMVQKILAYERRASFDLWRRRINLVAGVGGFGPMADAVIDLTARKLVIDEIPEPYHVSLTCASPQSPYCPEPARFHQTTLDRLNEGCLFWVYMGHGYRREVDRFRRGTQSYPILEADDAAKLQCRDGTPVALLLACYTGAFDGPEPCLAEELLKSPGGPVSVLCASRVTMPYGMTVLSRELLDQHFHCRATTLGEAVLGAKRAMLEPDGNSAARAGIDLVARLFNPADLAEERAEHAALFNLLGDPLLRLKHPAPIDLEFASTVEPGERLEVQGRTSIDGVGTVEIMLPRGAQAAKQARAAHQLTTAERARAQQSAYEQANDQRLAVVRVPVVDGQLRARFDVPDLPGQACLVRVFVQGTDSFALGSGSLVIRGREMNAGETAARSAAPTAPAAR